MLRYALLISVSIVISHVGVLFSHTHDVIVFHLCFCWLANAAFAVERNAGVNSQLVGISSNFAENVCLNSCPSQPGDTKERC